MPGAMETILDIGLNRDTLRGLIAQTGNPKFAWDSYRRFLENFGTVVFSHDPWPFTRKIVQESMEKERLTEEAALDFSALRSIAEDTKSCTRGQTEDGCLKMSLCSSNWPRPQSCSHGTAPVP